MEDPQISLSQLDAEIAKVRTHLEGLEAVREFILSLAKRQEGRKKQEAHKKGSPKAKRNLFGEPIPPYRGMGTKVAAIQYLREKGSPAGSSEIADALLRGGKETTSKTFHRTVHNTLEDASEKKSSEIVKIGKTWALKEWGLPPG